jgi:hypothetical protein
MDIHEPNLYEFASFTQSEEAATSFARERGLLVSAVAIQERQHEDTCLLGTPGCHGIVREKTKYDRHRHRSYNGFRCTGCKRFRSAKNALVNHELRGTTGALPEQRSFFASTSSDARSHTKLSVRLALAINDDICN